MILYIDMVLLSSLIFVSLVAHELFHYIFARMLGYDARLFFSRMGFGVRLKEFHNYERVTEIADEKMKRDYLFIGLAPYVLIPLYVLGFLFSPSTVLKVGFAIILLYHLPSFFVEFYQDTRSLYVTAGLFNILLFGFYLVTIK